MKSSVPSKETPSLKKREHDLFDALLAACSLLHLNNRQYDALARPTNCDGVMNVVGSLDCMMEIQLIIKEIENECERRSRK